MFKYRSCRFFSVHELSFLLALLKSNYNEDYFPSQIMSITQYGSSEHCGTVTLYHELVKYLHGE